MNTTNTEKGSAEGSAPKEGANWFKRIGIVAVIAAVIVGVRMLPTAEWIESVNEWVESLGVWGPLAYGGFYILAALLFIPGAAITLGAGTLFGILKGTIVVSLASTTAAALALPLARGLFRDKVQKFAQERPSFKAVDKAIEKGGWKVVGMLRLSPIVPFSALNYLLGITNVKYVPAVLISWIAMLPGTILYVYIGAIGKDVAAGGGGRTPGQWAMMIAGLVATIAVTVYLTKMAKAQMKTDTDIPADAN